MNDKSGPRRDEPIDAELADPESSLQASWSIGPLRPWMLRIAEQELPADLRGKVDPSDVVQQALLDAWRGQSDFRGTTHPQRLAWLRVILQRAMLQQRRTLLAAKRGGGNERAIAEAIARSSLRLEELAEGKEPSPQEAADGAEQSLLVAAAIERLPPDYRRVIELRHLQQKSHASIAAEMGRSPEAVRMIWVRALAQLREITRQFGGPS